MPSHHCIFFSFRFILRGLLNLQVLFIVSLTTTIANPTSIDGICATSYPSYDNRATRRWIFGQGRHHGIRNSDSSSIYWEEVADSNDRQNSDKEMDGSITPKHSLKNRLGLLHFGRIDLLSAYERYNSNARSLNKSGNRNNQEHPLRTNLWEMNLKWSLLSPNSKIKEKTVKIELHSEGYCRITGNTSSKNTKEQHRSYSPVLGLGRWKKRPWGVTIVIRPFFMPNSSLHVAKLDDDGNGRYENKACAKGNRDFAVVDEQPEFIFHAKNFHWNGFGSNPKLTQGTILLQKQKNRNNNLNWWRSTTWCSSPILPMWPEELCGMNGDDKLVENDGDGWGIVRSDLLGLLGNLIVDRSNRDSVSTQKRWFRPVVGTFIAKGIVHENSVDDWNEK